MRLNFPNDNDESNTKPRETGGSGGRPAEHNQYNPPRPGSQVQGGGNRPLRSFRNTTDGIGCSIWPAREDPEQPKFRIDSRYRDSRTGEWVDKKYFYYSEALSVLRVLYTAIAWACKEAGEPMPSLSLEGEAEAPRREFREPEDMRGQRSRQAVRGEDYNSRPGRYEDDDDPNTPF